MSAVAHKRNLRLLALCVVALIAIVIVAMQPPIPQPISYHQFADNRTLFGVPNFWNVISNVPFFSVGMIGLVTVLRGNPRGGLPSLRVAYACFFAGVALVCFGSAYYHWMPNNVSLAWDRLPMAFAFMAFVACIIGEHINEKVAVRLLLPLLALGIFSVWYWRYTEALGRGDLRLYALVQFLSLLLLPLIFLLFPSRFTKVSYLWLMLCAYAVAKLLEEADELLYSAGYWMAGHALKHIIAALGMYCFVIALKSRRLRD